MRVTKPYTMVMYCRERFVEDESVIGLRDEGVEEVIETILR